MTKLTDALQNNKPNEALKILNGSDFLASLEQLWAYIICSNQRTSYYEESSSLDPLHNTPFHLLAMSKIDNANFSALLRAFIRLGIDINRGNLKDETALHCAIRVGNLKFCESLIAAEIDINAICASGSALHMLIVNTNLKREQPEYYAIIMKLILRAKPLINQKYKHGVQYGRLVGNELHQAVHELDDIQDLDLFNDILEAISAPSLEIICIMDDTRHTALSLALLLGKTNFARELLKHGANVYTNGPPTFYDTRNKLPNVILKDTAKTVLNDAQIKSALELAETSGIKIAESKLPLELKKRWNIPQYRIDFLRVSFVKGISAIIIANTAPSYVDNKPVSDEVVGEHKLLYIYNGQELLSMHLLSDEVEIMQEMNNAVEQFDSKNQNVVYNTIHQQSSCGQARLNL